MPRQPGQKNLIPNLKDQAKLMKQLAEKADKGETLAIIGLLIVTELKKQTF